MLECKGTGRVAPVVDRGRCEAKGPCVAVCPYGVFAIRQLGPDEKAQMTLLQRAKAWAHGNEQAFVVQPDACHACGLCVTACPEKAIKLVPV